MKLFKSLASSLLAFLVLVSSSSFMVTMHFCGGHVQSFSLIEKAAPCVLEVEQAPCHKRMAIKKSTCCDDKEVAFEGKNFSNKVHSLSPNTSLSIAVLPLIIEVVQINTARIASNHNSYKPPIVDRDIPVLIQSFLI